MPAFTPEQARRFYDRFGARQDSQAFYEDAALRKLIAHAAFDASSAVIEFGCGTGRLAEMILSESLPPSARYLGLDISPVMISLAEKRLRGFGDRVSLRLADGTTGIDVPSESYDRFVSTYVFDLLSTEDAHTVAGEAYRVLEAGGLICLTGLGAGSGVFSKAVAMTWSVAHRIRPQLVGGCRPVALRSFLPPEQWELQCHESLSPWAIPSEIAVARKLQPPSTVTLPSSA